jgi:hypothetical protein
MARGWRAAEPDGGDPRRPLERDHRLDHSIDVRGADANDAWLLAVDRGDRGHVGADERGRLLEEHALDILGVGSLGEPLQQLCEPVVPARRALEPLAAANPLERRRRAPPKSPGRSRSPLPLVAAHRREVDRLGARGDAGTGSAPSFQCEELRPLASALARPRAPPRAAAPSARRRPDRRDRLVAHEHGRGLGVEQLDRGRARGPRPRPASPSSAAPTSPASSASRRRPASASAATRTSSSDAAACLLRTVATSSSRSRARPGPRRDEDGEAAPAGDERNRDAVA